MWEDLLHHAHTPTIDREAAVAGARVHGAYLAHGQPARHLRRALRPDGRAGGARQATAAPGLTAGQADAPLRPRRTVLQNSF